MIRFTVDHPTGAKNAFQLQNLHHEIDGATPGQLL